MRKRSNSSVATAPWQQLRGNSSVATAPWQQLRGNSSVATAPWQQLRGNSSVATAPWQQLRGNSSVATAPWQQLRGNSSVATAPWQQLRGNSSVAYKYNKCNTFINVDRRGNIYLTNHSGNGFSGESSWALSSVTSVKSFKTFWLSFSVTTYTLTPLAK